MNFFLFASSIIFFLWLAFKLKNDRKIEDAQQKSFWDLENKANSTRRKPLDDLDYINIPFASLPLDILADDEQIADYIDTLRILSENPIVNLSCISNTDLKLRYGAPNITILSRYDSAYTILARTLQQWAMKLSEAGFLSEARDVLEFAISTKTDVSGTYLKLAEIYIGMGQIEKIDELILAAEGISSSFGKGIKQKLIEMK
ncbi:MAG: hypothetical protein FWG91_08665 [Lachnospiraceae bacterium]|nr:hypothetical protein [Lachnospiraceae bacterium]